MCVSSTLLLIYSTCSSSGYQFDFHWWLFARFLRLGESGRGCADAAQKSNHHDYYTAETRSTGLLAFQVFVCCRWFVRYMPCVHVWVCVLLFDSQLFHPKLLALLGLLLSTTGRSIEDLVTTKCYKWYRNAHRTMHIITGETFSVCVCVCFNWCARMRWKVIDKIDFLFRSDSIEWISGTAFAIGKRIIIFCKELSLLIIHQCCECARDSNE